jgi:hypothetical protein
MMSFIFVSKKFSKPKVIKKNKRQQIQIAQETGALSHLKMPLKKG